MPAKVPNPRKQFQFNIIMAGLNPFLAQDVKLPDEEFDVATHGDTNFEVKTAGMKKIGNLTVTKIQPAIVPDAYFRDWARRIQNQLTGGGELPSVYKQTVMVEELGNDGITVVERHIYGGCWPTKLNGKDLSRKGSDNTIHSLEFSVDEIL